MAARDAARARLRASSARDAGVRAIVLAGAGEQAFTAGGDIAGVHAARRRDADAPARERGRARALPASPSWRALHGYCFGVGLELALACDLRVAADDAQLALPEITLGMIPGSGGTQRLVHLVGLARAKDMVMRGRRISARRRRWPGGS